MSSSDMKLQFKTQLPNNRGGQPLYMTVDTISGNAKITLKESQAHSPEGTFIYDPVDYYMYTSDKAFVIGQDNEDLEVQVRRGGAGQKWRMYIVNEKGYTIRVNNDTHNASAVKGDRIEVSPMAHKLNQSWLISGQ